MSVAPARRVELSNYFLDKLAAIEGFSSQYNAIAARAFTAAVFTFCYDILAAQPWAYPAFKRGRTAPPTVRRAVFRRHYVLLYRVADEAIYLLDIYHARQGGSALSGAEFSL